MPEGTDLITWSPRRGTSGDDRYDVPDNTHFEAGDYAGYSDPPTLAEVNAGSGLNQIIAEYKRRRIKSDDMAVISWATTDDINYVDVNDVKRATHYTDLQTQIYNLRKFEVQSIFSFTSIVINDPVKMQHILELRKALAIDHYAVYPSKSKHPYGASQYLHTLAKTGQTESEYQSDAGVAAFGYNMDARSGVIKHVSEYDSYRGFVGFSIPNFTGSLSKAILSHYGSVDVNTTGEIITVATDLGVLDVTDWGATLSTIQSTRSGPVSAGRYEEVLTGIPGGGDPVAGSPYWLAFFTQMERLKTLPPSFGNYLAVIDVPIAGPLALSKQIVLRLFV